MTESAKPREGVAERHLWQITPARDILIFVMTALLLWFVYSLREIFVPVLIALVLAYLFNPLITRLEVKRGWPRTLTIALLLVIVTLALIGLIAWLGPLLMQQVRALAGKLPDYVQALSTRYNLDLDNLLQQFQQPLKDLQSEPQKVAGEIFQTTGRAIGWLTTAFSTATYVVISVTLIVIYFFIFAWRFNAGTAKLKAYLPRSRREKFLEIIAKMDAAVANFFRGRLVIAVIIGISLSIGWFFTGVPYWFFLGIVTGFLSIVPYVSLITWPIAVMLKYLDSMSGGAADLNWTSIAVWPSLVFVVVQFLEGWVLTPWIQSEQTEMNAATVLLVVLIGGAVAGFWGLLFSIPIASCIKILFDELVFPRIKQWAATH